MNFAQRLKELRKSKGISQYEFAKAIGKSKSLISMYESGERIPPFETQEVIADYFNVGLDYLMGRVDYPDFYSHPDILPIKTKKIPIIGGVACGEPIYQEEDFECYIEADADIKADFAMRCYGDSMVNIGIKDGYIVFIKKQPMVNNGEVAAVNIEGEFTLKRFFQYGDTVVLRSENSDPEYKDLQYHKGSVNSFVILGKAVAFQGYVK